MSSEKHEVVKLKERPSTSATPLNFTDTQDGLEGRPGDWTTTRRELWSYYLYYIGNNGLSGFNFGPSQFQNLLFLAGYDPSLGPGSSCGDNSCVLLYLGKTRDSMLICFAALDNY